MDNTKQMMYQQRIKIFEGIYQIERILDRLKKEFGYDGKVEHEPKEEKFNLKIKKDCELVDKLVNKTGYKAIKNDYDGDRKKVYYCCITSL